MSLQTACRSSEGPNDSPLSLILPFSCRLPYLSKQKPSSLAKIRWVNDGLFEGINDGMMLGSVDGLCDGFVDGSDDGEMLGRLDGCLDGSHRRNNHGCYGFWHPHFFC